MILKCNGKIILTSQALMSLYIIRQYFASSIGKYSLEWLIKNGFQDLIVDLFIMKPV
jgi:hypothetical protein